MKKIVFLFLTFVAFTLSAQTTIKLAAYYCFNDAGNLAVDCGMEASKAILSPIPPKAICGVNGNAIQLLGNEYVILADISSKFTTGDFTVSFYFKPTGTVGIRDMFSNRDSCTNRRAFAIQYDASARTVKIKLKDEKRGIEMTAKIDNSTCWQHITFSRNNNYHRLYINGVRKEVKYSPDNQRINLFSSSIFFLGKSGCDPAVPGSHFKGIMDEVRVYTAALKEDEIQALYSKPERIKNEDALVFVGENVAITSQSSCASKFGWTPTNGVSNPSILSPVIKPEKPGTYAYTLRFTDSLSSCAAYDTVRITVVDPTQTPCSNIFVPNAFTPNADDVNETFGLSNPYTIGELANFEILDRWGGRMFQTSDAFGRWDGRFNGQLAQPGTYLYRIKYKCQNEERSKFGSFVLIQ